MFTVDLTVETSVGDVATVSYESDLETGGASFDDEDDRVLFETVEDKVELVPSTSLELSVLLNGNLTDVAALGDPWEYRAEATSVFARDALKDDDCQGETKLEHYYANVFEDTTPQNPGRDIVVNTTFKEYDGSGEEPPTEWRPEETNSGNPVVTSVTHKWDFSGINGPAKYEVQYEVRVDGTTTQESPWLTVEDNEC